MRALGLDLGERRIGVAVGDSDGRVATPLTVLERSGDRAADHRAVAALVAEWEAGIVVVGMPYSLDGTQGPAARAAADEAARLGAGLGVPASLECSQQRHHPLLTNEKHTCYRYNSYFQKSFVGHR